MSTRLAVIVLIGVGAAVVAQPERDGRADQFVNRVMQGDADGDGMLAKSEAPPRWIEEGTFDNADADKDGFLTREEVRGFLMQRTGGRTPGPPPRVQPEGDMSFHDAMENAGRAMRGLRRSDFNDESRPRDLDALQALQNALLSAKASYKEVDMAPQAREKFDGDAEAYEREFRLTLVKALATTLAIEEAVLNGESEQAQNLVGELRAVQGAGHDVFQDEDH